MRNPFEVVKQNMQIGKYERMGEAFARIASSRGLRGFYVGYGSLVMREVPFSCIQMPLYEALKRHVTFGALPEELR